MTPRLTPRLGRRNPARSRLGRATSATIASLLMVATLVVVALFSGATQAEAIQPDRSTPPVDAVEELRLGCRTGVVDGQRGILCRWSEAHHDRLRGYQLYRIVNGSPRELVVTVAAGERLHAFDANVQPGDHVIYGVVARNRSGRVVGIGGPVRVAIPS